METENQMFIDERVDIRTFNESPNFQGVVRQTTKYSPGLLSTSDFFDLPDDQLFASLSPQAQTILRSYDACHITTFRQKMSNQLRTAGTINKLISRNGTVTMAWNDQKKKACEDELSISNDSLQVGLKAIHDILVNISIPYMFRSMLCSENVRIEYDIGSIAGMCGYLKIPIKQIDTPHHRMTAFGLMFSKTRVTFEQLALLEATCSLKPLLGPILKLSSTMYPLKAGIEEGRCVADVDTREPRMLLQVKRLTQRSNGGTVRMMFGDESKSKTEDEELKEEGEPETSTSKSWATETNVMFVTGPETVPTPPCSDDE